MVTTDRFVRAVVKAMLMKADELDAIESSLGFRMSTAVIAVAVALNSCLVVRNTNGADLPPATTVAESPLPKSVLSPPATNTPPNTPTTTPQSTPQKKPVVPARSLLVLGKSPQWSLGHEYRGLLSRELARQAFLFTARERFGLTTRDYWLEPTSAIAEPSLSFDVVGSGFEESFVELLEGTAPIQESLRSWSFPSQWEPKFNVAKFAENCEQLARTDFVELLQQRTGRRGAGFDTRSPAAPLPAEIEASLAEVDVVALFLVLRRLHASDPAQIGALAKFGGLSRGYALLGMLTEYYWHPMHNVFKARALLYAQTLAAYAPRDPNALWHRGFAYALTGLHAPALVDFEQARLAAAANGIKTPAWAATAEAHCRYDVRSLGAVAAGDSAFQLAILLRVASYELSPVPRVVKDSLAAPVTKRAVAAGSEAVNRLPHCGWIAHSFEALRYSETGLPSGGPSVGPWRSSAYSKLPAVADLPAQVKAALGEAALGEAAKVAPEPGSPSEMTLRAALIEALDDEELSLAEQRSGAELTWRVLSKILLEESFLENLPDLTQRSGLLPLVDPEAKGRWRADRKSVEQVLKKHPFRDFVFGGTANEAENLKIVEKYASALDVDAMEFKESWLIHSLHTISAARHDKFMHAALEHRERATGDFFMRNATNSLETQRMNELLELSPYSPVARAFLCEKHWDKVAKNAAQWEQDAADHPGVLTAIGMQHVKAGKLDDAERCLAKAVKLEADIRNRAALAEVYKRRGNAEKWAAEMEALAKDNPAEAGRIQAAIAGFYLQQRNFPRAQELSESAARDNVLEGMVIASAVYELMQDWRNSEFWIEELSKEHPVYRYQWYLWCKRTGRGNVKEAEKDAAAFLVDRRKDQSDSYAFEDEYQRNDLPGVIQLLRGDLDNARLFFEGQLNRTTETWSGLHAAMIADRQKDTKRRDELLKQIFSRPPTAYARRLPKRVELRAVAQWIIDDLAAGGRGELSREALDKAINGATLLEGGHCYYILGDYLERHGKPDVATEYWTKNMLLPPVAGLSRTLAGAALVKKGVKPESYRDLLQRPPKSALPK